MTQAELAEKAGLSRWWVNEFESGHPRAELHLVMNVLDALELSIDITPIETAPDELLIVDADGHTRVNIRKHLEKYLMQL